MLKRRTGTPADLLVVGLGNPGKDYAGTRHNVGQEAVELLAQRHGASLKGGKHNALVGEARIGGKLVALAVPVTYMNESGLAVQSLVKRYSVGEDDWTRLLVVQDELDLPPGTVRVKVGGGLAGNNGLRSITKHLKTQDYARVRIGVGKPPNKEQGANHVLKRPSRKERTELDIAVQEAAGAVELYLAEGAEAAMTRFNQKP
jgi:PTH1 family peptidyl-tRNA hydrolase